MTALTYTGRKVGENWRDLQDKLHYVDYLMAVLIVAGAAWLILRWWKGRGKGEIDAAVADDLGSTADASVEPNANEPAL